MEAVAANPVPAVELVGDAVEVGRLGHRRVERGVEHGDLRHTLSQEGDGRRNAPQVAGVVQWGQLDALGNAIDHGLIDAHGRAKVLPTMDHAVPDGVDVAQRHDAVDLRVGPHHPPEHQIDRGPVVA